MFESVVLFLCVRNAHRITCFVHNAYTHAL